MTWVTVKSFMNSTEAYLAKAFLESRDITVFLKDEYLSNINIYASAIGGIKLMVLKEDVEKARELLFVEKDQLGKDKNDIQS